jgi:hypothetical protein
VNLRDLVESEDRELRAKPTPQAVPRGPLPPLPSITRTEPRRREEPRPQRASEDHTRRYSTSEQRRGRGPQQARRLRRVLAPASRNGGPQ